MKEGIKFEPRKLIFRSHFNHTLARCPRVAADPSPSSFTFNHMIFKKWHL
jgi:hypothetical protein